MKLLSAMSLLIALTGCGSRPHVDSAFAPYVSQFQQLLTDNHVSAVINTYNVTVEFGDPKSTCSTPEAAGCCDPGFSRPTITIDKTTWDGYEGEPTGEDMRQAIIYHELGHCVLRRSHNSETVVYAAPSAIRPESIMNPDATYAATWIYLVPALADEYYQELLQYSPRDN